MPCQVCGADGEPVTWWVGGAPHLARAGTATRRPWAQLSTWGWGLQESPPRFYLGWALETYSVHMGKLRPTEGWRVGVTEL